MNSFKAAVLEEIGKPPVIRDIIAPDLKKGHVLVRIAVSGLCGAQIQEMHGHKGNAKFLPHLVGHEGYGEVVDKHPTVTKVSVGDKVVLHWRKGSGIEADNPVYTRADNGILIGAGKCTTLSQYSIVSENRATKVQTTPEIGALLGCSLSTSLAIIEKESKIKIGGKYLILGMGSIGIGLSIFIDHFGGEVHYLDREYKNNVKFARHVQKQDIQKNIYESIYDTTGDFNLVLSYLFGLKPSGNCVLVAQPAPNSTASFISPNTLFGESGITIQTTQGGGFDPDCDMQRYASFLEKIDRTDSLITKLYDLSMVDIAYRQLIAGQSGKTLIYT